MFEYSVRMQHTFAVSSESARVHTSCHTRSLYGRATRYNAGVLLGVALAVFAAVLLTVQPCGAVQRVQASGSPHGRIGALLGIPYRDDGALDYNGQYTLFARPEARFDTPGLNCSGFVLAAARILLNCGLSPAEAARDRLGDSGDTAPDGKDWDFGWDIIMNISEGHPRRMLLPQRQATAVKPDTPNAAKGASANVLADVPTDVSAGTPATLDATLSTGKGPLGYPLTAKETWAELEERVHSGFMYLLSFSKPGTQAPYSLLHYHVGFLLRGDSGELLLCQTTHQGKVSSCRNMSDPKVLSTFRKQFASKKGQPKRMMVLEVALPEA